MCLLEALVLHPCSVLQLQANTYYPQRTQKAVHVQDVCTVESHDDWTLGARSD